LTARCDSGSRRLKCRVGEGKLNGRRISKHHSEGLRTIRRAMAAELETALRALAAMNPQAAREAGNLITGIAAIKSKIEDRARALGYAEKCRRSIAVCAGECCRWHFPKHLSRVDFFAAVFTLPAADRAALTSQVRRTGDRVYQCPLLLSDGCIFSFENRPTVCTAAYPCLAGSGYWEYKERFRNELTRLRKALRKLVDKYGVDPRDEH